MGRERTEWTILGRVIGTATGWDELGDHDIILYDFKPADGVDLPAGDIGVLFEKGLFELYDDESEGVSFSADIIATLGNVARPAA